MDGILIINKPRGVTSRDVVNKLTRKLNFRKIGHTGTLDPFATGVLLIVLGKATKALPFLDNLLKTYQATLLLGNQTDTGDCDGEVILSKDVPSFSKKEVEEVLKSFKGYSMQKVPRYSAAKIEGVPLYKLARAGKVVECPNKKIFISAISLQAISAKEITFEVTCSTGTFIRTLGEDIAQKLKTVGHLTKLHRKSIGNFKDEASKTIEEVQEENLISVRNALSHMPTQIVEGSAIKQVKDGKILSFSRQEKRLLICDEKDVIAVMDRQEDGTYKVKRGLF